MPSINIDFKKGENGVIVNIVPNYNAADKEERGALNLIMEVLCGIEDGFVLAGHPDFKVVMNASNALAAASGNNICTGINRLPVDELPGV